METHGALSLFNGVFFAFYESTQISGNLIASLVLTKGSYNQTALGQDGKVCGAGEGLVCVTVTVTVMVTVMAGIPITCICR